MNKTGKTTILVLTILVTVLLFTPVATASHTTCVEDESGNAEAFCGVPVDWMDIFEQTEGPSDTTLTSEPSDVRGTMASQANSQYRNLYQGLGIVLNEEIEDVLTGRTREVDEADSFWKGRYFDNELGFPPYRYQVHYWDSGGNNCEWIEKESQNADGETTTKEYMIINSGNSCGEAGGPNPDIVYGPLVDGNGGEDDSELNKFEFDTVFANVQIPEGSRVIVNIYEEGARDNKVAEAVFTSSNSRVDTISRSSVSVSETDVSEYDGDYYISVEMEKDSDDVESPKFGGRVLISRDYPEFRTASLPFSTYPDILDELNRKMYGNYNQKYFSTTDNSETSTTPRLDESNYADAKVSNPSSFEHFTEETYVFHNSYAEIANINPSVLTSNVGVDESYDLDGNWRRVIDEDGKVYVTYDTGVNSPDRQNDFSGEPSDGDLRWTYDYDEDDVEYEIEFGYEYFDIADSSSSGFIGIIADAATSIEKQQLEEITREEPGVATFDYSMEEDNIDENIYKFYADVRTTVTYDIDYEEYDVETEDCPPDQIDNTIERPPPGPEGNIDPYNGPDGCSSSAGTYIVSEGWENYVGTPPGKDDEVSISTEDDVMDSDERDKLEAESRSVLTPDTREFEEDDFRISRLHTVSSDDGDRLLFNRTKDKDLEDTRWTRMVGTSISRQGTVQINSNSTKYDSDFGVPTISPISSGQSSPVNVNIDRGDDGTVELDDVDVESNYAVDGTIGENQNVTVDLFVSGPAEPADDINVYIGDEMSGTFNIPFVGSGSDHYERVTDLDTESGEETLNISEQTRGKSSIELNFEYKGSELESPVRVDYIIKIESDKEINQFKSRWSYATFRDARWDVIYTHNEACDEEDNCYDYSKHGTPIADSKINNGETRGFPEEGGVPDSLDYTYPSGTLPVNAYLIPTTDTLLTQRSAQSNTVFPPVATDEPRTAGELNDLYVEALRSDEPRHYFEPAQVSTPMISDMCAEAPVPNEEDEWENYCDLYSGYLANNTIESDIVKRIPGSESFKERYGESDYEAGSLSDSIEDKDTNPLSVSQTITHSDYVPLRNESTSEYRELMSFEAVLNNGATDWGISGDASWQTKDVGIQREEYIMHSTNIEIQRIENPREKLSDEKISELRSEEVDHQILSEDAPEGVHQFKIRFEDEYGNPVSIVDRKFGGKGVDDNVELLRVSDTERYIDATGTALWMNESFMTNENGVVYVTANTATTDNNQLVVKYEGNKGDWWLYQTSTSGSTKRLLESTQGVFDVSDDENDPQSTQNWWRLFIGAVFLILGFFFVLSRALRTYPNANISVKELIGIIVEPFWDTIKDIFVYFISLMILTFVGLVFLGLLSGGDASIFEYINPIVDSIFG